MKIFLNLCCVASTACLVSLVAGEFGFAPRSQAMSSKGVTANPSRSGTMTFSPFVRSKVAQYFDTYRTELNGLPPSCMEGNLLTQIPLAWTQAWLPIGTIIEETVRDALIKVPAELERVLTVHSEVSIHYYLAGKNLVALDSRFQVVDTVWIPTIRLGEDSEPLVERDVIQFVNQTEE